MITKLLTDRVGYSGDVKEIRQEWLRDLFYFIGLDVEAMDEMERDEILDYMLENEIEVIEHKSIDALEVMFNGELIGEWAGPELVLKEDKDGSLYYEIKIEHWTIEEDQIE